MSNKFLIYDSAFDVSEHGKQEVQTRLLKAVTAGYHTEVVRHPSATAEVLQHCLEYNNWQAYRHPRFPKDELLETIEKYGTTYKDFETHWKKYSEIVLHPFAPQSLFQVIAKQDLQQPVIKSIFQRALLNPRFPAEILMPIAVDAQSPFQKFAQMSPAVPQEYLQAYSVLNPENILRNPNTSSAVMLDIALQGSRPQMGFDLRLSNKDNLSPQLIEIISEWNLRSRSSYRVLRMFAQNDAPEDTIRRVINIATKRDKNVGLDLDVDEFVETATHSPVFSREEIAMTLAVSLDISEDTSRKLYERAKLYEREHSRTFVHFFPALFSSSNTPHSILHESISANRTDGFSRTKLPVDLHLLDFAQDESQVRLSSHAHHTYTPRTLLPLLRSIAEAQEQRGNADNTPIINALNFREILDI